MEYALLAMWLLGAAIANALYCLVIDDRHDSKPWCFSAVVWSIGWPLLGAVVLAVIVYCVLAMAARKVAR
jgi:hypothetical protein